RKIVFDASTHAISVVVDGSNPPTPANSIQVGQGDSVTWTCDHAFAIQFVSEGPPGSSDRADPPLDRLQDSRGKDKTTSPFQVKVNATPNDRWDYVIALTHNDTIYTVDPDIVIKSR
ncbi:MAG: hypothetical protein OEZ37_00660, partial [Gemmatimonadota bacterium]|nr:hypothetical protein [Gemmatimonadota bacterium]